MRVWRRLWEAVGGDDGGDDGGDGNDELGGFAGQAARWNGLEPPWDGRSPMPSGRVVHRKVVLPDGSEGMAYRLRGDGLYDVHVHLAAKHGYSAVLHPSEFRFVEQFPRFVTGVDRRPFRGGREGN